ncbi:cell division protein CrgA [Corynebacterium ulceribovis]|uniref:cell division protein CrgA n=1 Tax=Corynebacterium ulceribovis TaxID=487732 RepID=UPI0003676C9A|nr:cell division protein CrgA [Corynebacterium ulceribovis]
MPKAKVTVNSSHESASSGVSRTPVKINVTSTPIWYKVIMFGLMIVGLGWLIVNYLAGPSIPFMADLNAWNYLIGFSAFLAGLLMTMGWK